MKPEDLRAAILDGLAPDVIPGTNAPLWFDDVASWSDLRTPIVVIEERSAGGGDSLGTPFPGEYLEFSACCIIRSTDTSALRKARNLATAVAQVVHATDWGIDDVGLAQTEIIEDDQFRPEWKEFAVMRVDFRHHCLIDMVTAEWATL